MHDEPEPDYDTLVREIEAYKAKIEARHVEPGVIDYTLGLIGWLIVWGWRLFMLAVAVSALSGFLTPWYQSLRAMSE